MTNLTLKLEPVIRITSDKFYEICQQNPDLKLERNVQGELTIMPPTGGETGRCNSSLNAQLWLWNEQTKLGEVFDSSTGFSLPNGADRSPDNSWIEKSKWDSLNASKKEKFISFCPDFVVEILSPTDSLKKTQEKMQEYMDNGCRLGWLINRKKQEVEIYRIGKKIEILSSPSTLSGEDILPGFILDLTKIWL